jgi:hypothetical protein
VGEDKTSARVFSGPPIAPSKQRVVFVQSVAEFPQPPMEDYEYSPDNNEETAEYDSIEKCILHLCGLSQSRRYHEPLMQAHVRTNRSY